MKTKKVSQVLIFFILAIAVAYCSKQKIELGGPESQSSAVVFKSAANSSKSVLNVKAAADAKTLLISVIDSEGKTVFDNKALTLYQVGGNFVSESLQMAPGTYHLTQYMVADQNNTIIYATPLAGSSLAYLVNNPLPREFTIQKDLTTTVSPEIIAIETHTAADFGYATFNLNIVETFHVLMSVYDANNQLTTAQVSVKGDNVEIYNGMLDAKTNDLRLRDGYAQYQVIMTKDGGVVYSQTFTAADFKKYQTQILTIALTQVSSYQFALTAAFILKHEANKDLVDYSNGGFIVSFFLKDADGKYVSNNVMNENITVFRPANLGSFIIHNQPVASYNNGRIVDGVSFYGLINSVKYWYWLDWDENLMTNTPVSGDYTLTATDINGKSIVGIARFDRGNGDPINGYPTITNFDTASKTITWNQTTGQKCYRVFVSKGDLFKLENVVYNSSSSSNNFYCITANNYQIPVELITGEKYTFIVDAYDSATGNILDSNYMHRSKPATYSIVNGLSNNANLSGISLSSGSLSPAFNQDTLNYAVTVENSISSIVITPISAESHAIIKVNGANVLSGSQSDPIPLNAGINTISILVTAQDGSTSKSYTLSINKPAWQIVGNAGFNSTGIFGSKIFIMNGIPHVAYIEGQESGTIIFKKFNGSTWDPINSIDMSWNVRSFSLVEENGNIYLAYLDNDSFIYVKKFSDGNWINLGASISKTYSSYSLTVINGTPYVFYQDFNYNNRAAVKKFDGANWVNEGDFVSEGSSDCLSITHGHGTLYAAFIDNSNGYPRKDVVKKFDGINWVNAGLISQGSESFYTSLIFSNEMLYLVSEDYGNVIKRFDGLNWEVIGSFTHPYGAQYISFAAYNQMFYMFFQDSVSANYKGSVRSFNGGNWINVGNTAFTLGAVDYVSITVHNGIPYVAYADFANGNRITVMKYK